MIHTSYVPLEHPFRIIEYNTTLGIQIGTLVVTKELETKKKNGYSIETHSHPVVSYVNNQYKPKDGLYRSMKPLTPEEGVVWDKVEIGEVTTIGREGEVLRWRDMMSIVKNWRIAEEAGILQKNVSHAIMDSIGILFDWNLKIKDPIVENKKERDSIDIYLSMQQQYGKEFIVGEEGMGLAVLANRKDIYNQLLKQAHWIWSTIFFYHSTNKTKQLNIRFFTDDVRLIDLTGKLNLGIRQGISPDNFNGSLYEDYRALFDPFGLNKRDNEDK